MAYSGKTFNVVHYSVDDKTERLDYDAIRDLALKSRPKMIIAGYTSYPWAPDWQTFRAIADEVGAYLLADIAHVAGLTAAGAIPSPVGIADAVMFTTHKTFNGPRGAVIITHKATLGEQIDRRLPGVPGRTAYGGRCRDRGGGKMAGTDRYRALQRRQSPMLSHWRRLWRRRAFVCRMAVRIPWS